MTLPRFLRSTTGWSFVVAALALVLSLVGPVRDLVVGARARVIMGRPCQLGHDVGNVVVGLPVLVENTGGRPVTASLECVLSDKDGHVLPMRAQSQSLKAAAANAPLGTVFPLFPLGSLILKPGEVWSEFVRFESATASEDEANVGQVRNSVLAASFETVKYVQGQAQERALPKEVVRHAQELFHKRFHLYEGSYSLAVGLRGEDGKLIHAEGYNVVLLDSYQLNVLRNLTNSYSSMEGFQRANLISVYVGLSLPMPKGEPEALLARGQQTVGAQR